MHSIHASDFLNEPVTPLLLSFVLVPQPAAVRAAKAARAVIIIRLVFVICVIFPFLSGIYDMCYFHDHLDL